MGSAEPERRRARGKGSGTKEAHNIEGTPAAAPAAPRHSSARPKPAIEPAHGGRGVSGSSRSGGRGAANASGQFGAAATTAPPAHEKTAPAAAAAAEGTRAEGDASRAGANATGSRARPVGKGRGKGEPAGGGKASHGGRFAGEDKGGGHGRGGGARGGKGGGRRGAADGAGSDAADGEDYRSPDGADPTSRGRRRDGTSKEGMAGVAHAEAVKVARAAATAEARRRKAEEELQARLRAEEEAARIAEAERAAAEAAAETARLAEAAAVLAARVALRDENVQCQRPSETDLKGRDSSLKRMEALRRKLKASIGEDAKASLLAELPKLNLSKFMDEIASAIGESRLKLSDVSSAAAVCSHLHRTYAAFGGALLPSLRRAIETTAPPAAAETDGERTARLARRRALLRLMWELVALNVFPSASAVLATTRALTEEDATASPLSPMPNLPVLQALAKHVATDPLLISPVARAAKADIGIGDAGAHAVPHAAGATTDASSGKGDAVSPTCSLSSTEEAALLFLLHSYFDEAVAALSAARIELHASEKTNARTLLVKGELSDEAATAHDRSKKAVERLESGCTAMGEALRREVPQDEGAGAVGAEEGVRQEVLISVHGVDGQSAREESAAAAGFDDEDDAAFYLQLPDLRAALPAVLFEGSAPGAPATAEASRNTNEASSKDVPSDASGFDEAIATLSACTSKAEIDNLASELCIRGLRDRTRRVIPILASPLSTSTSAPRLHARLTAVLAAAFRSIGTEVAALVSTEFDELFDAGCNQRHPAAVHSRPLASRGMRHHGPGAGDGGRDLGARVRNAAFVGELAKFSLVSGSTIFAMLKRCVDAFSPPQIAVMCTLLGSCGRFLHASPETTERCDSILDLITRVRSVNRSMPAELLADLDSAVAACRPPPPLVRSSAALEPLQRYIIYLLDVSLTPTSAERVVRQLRKLSWTTEPRVKDWFVDIFLESAQVRYHSIPWLACVASQLYHSQEEAVLSAVDAAIEALRLAIDRADPVEGRRRGCLIRLAAELYAYKLIDSKAVFRILYWLLPKQSGVWGCVVPLTHVAAHAESRLGAEPTARPISFPNERMVDPPHDCGRLRMALSMLQVVGVYFSRGTPGRRLDVFLVYLSRYLFCKTIALDVRFQLSDTLEELRPGLKLPATYEAACAAVERLEASIASDPIHGDAIAHELLHATDAPPPVDGEAMSDEEEAEEEGETSDSGDDGDEDDGEEGGVDDEFADEEQAAMEAELKALDEQLAQLGVDDDDEDDAVKGEDANEEESFGMATTRREATAEEMDAFDAEMAMFLSDSREQGKKHVAPKPAPDAPRLAMALLTRPAGADAKGSAGGAAASGAPCADNASGAMKLRVMCKRPGAGTKAKVEAAEVAVPRDAPLARTLIEISEKSNEERLQLKKKIMAVAAEQESAGLGMGIYPIRQNPAGERDTRVSSSRASNFKSSGRLH